MAVSAETGGPGDDLRVEFADGGVLEVQAKRGLQRGGRLWEAVLLLARGLAADACLRCVLLVDPSASRSVREELGRDIPRVAHGRRDRLGPITEDLLVRLRDGGLADDDNALEGLLGRLSVVTADLGDKSEGEALALRLLSEAAEKTRMLDSWVALKDDGMRLAATSDRRDLTYLWRLLARHEIRPAEPAGRPADEMEDAVPSVPRPFVGRDQTVQEVGEGLAVDRPRPLVAVRGLPGSGKTSVAAAVAEDLRLSFPGGVLWAPVGPEPSPLTVLSAWGRTLGVEELVNYADVGAARNRMKALLRGRKALLVLDDVWEPEHALPFDVGDAGSATLATTRSPDVARELAAGGVVDLEVLGESDAVSLLEELAPSLGAADRAGLPELAARLGYLPLMLRVAGRLLEEEASLGLGADGLLAELTERKRLLGAEAPADLHDLSEGATPTVAALVERSTERLGADDRERFARLAAFTPGPATFDLEAARDVWGSATAEAREGLRELARRGLVEPDGSGRFALHPVLHMQAGAMLGRTPDEGREARYLHAEHYLGLLRSADALFSVGGEAHVAGAALFDAEWENTRAGQAWSASRVSQALDEARAARLVSGYADAGWRWLDVRVGLEERARWQQDALTADDVLIEAMVFAEVVDENPEETQQTFSSAKARHLHLLANIKLQSGRLDEAFAHEREAREIQRSLGDGRGESRTLNGLAVLYTREGAYDLAEASYLEGLRLLDVEHAEGHAPTEKGRDRDRAALLGNLGTFYRHRGRPEEAEVAVRGAISVFRAIRERAQVGIALNNLGALRSELLDDRPGALKAFRAAQKIFRDLGRRQDEAHSLLAIGREHANAGEFRRAKLRAEEVVAVCREVGDRSMEGWGLDVLGDARLGLDDKAGAKETYLEVLRLARDAVDKRLEVMAFGGLGRTALADEKPREALRHFEEALVITQAVPLPHMGGSMLVEVAMALDALGDRDAAVAKAEEALTESENLRAADAERLRAKLEKWYEDRA